MADASVLTVTDDDFDDQVIAGSRQKPVLVDFWAPWCGPCRMIGPVLEKLAGEMHEQVTVAKLNVDENPIVAARFGVRSIPAVKLWAGGDKVAEFVGALPEGQIRAFLDQHLPSEAASHAALAEQLWTAGDVATAEVEARAATSAGGSHAAGGHLILARIELGRLQVDQVKEHVAAIAPAAGEWQAGQSLLAAAELVEMAMATGDREQVAERAGAEGASMDDLLAHSIYTMAGGDYRAALDGLLALVERDRKWNDEAARKAMLVVFDLAGTRSELSDEYRRRLSILL